MTAGILAGVLILASCSKAESSGPETSDTPSAPSVKAVVDGRIVATIGGEKREWYVTHVDSDGEWKSGSFWRDAPMKSAHLAISGLTEKDIKPTGKGDMRLSMIVTNLSGSPQVMSSQMFFLPDGPVKAWASDENGSFAVVVDHVSIDGDFLELEGDFAGEVALDAKYDTEMPRTFKVEDGAFDVRVRKYD
ncbi:hypothetical protein [Hyphomonas johnsonii]|uniref:hypothetical protein n=1 Tax=Hyphomonas johnsonii TaxID=81031 RepID=UPI00054E0258|nr:hypothetical protein [Hyphomonas johnsonii]